MPTIRRVLETALYVDDMERARAFYGDLLGLEVMMESERLVALHAGGSTVLLLFQRGATTQGLDTEGGWIPPHDGHGPSHFAFAIDEDQVDAWVERLEGAKIEIESRVRWPAGGTSLYFRDPEGHSVELATPGLWPAW